MHTPADRREARWPRHDGEARVYPSRKLPALGAFAFYWAWAALAIGALANPERLVELEDYSPGLAVIVLVLAIGGTISQALTTFHPGFRVMPDGVFNPWHQRANVRHVTWDRVHAVATEVGRHGAYLVLETAAGRSKVPLRFVHEPVEFQRDVFTTIGAPSLPRLWTPALQLDNESTVDRLLTYAGVVLGPVLLLGLYEFVFRFGAEPPHAVAALALGAVLLVVLIARRRHIRRRYSS